MSQTIVALATAAGRSGIGVIRISGGGALGVVRELLDDSGFSPSPRKAVLRSLKDAKTGDIIDEALITYFASPNSFTGEDVIEISCHGSPVLLRRVLDLCLSFGARLAEPGEFSLRALANGRIDLAEAEAIRDLIDARTNAAALQAVRQLRGEFSSSLQPLKDDLLNIIVVLESALEFVEDDLPETQLESVTEDLHSIAADIEKFADTYSSGKLLREGLRVALAGRPNVGKSSLFNALLGTDRAIVTDIAGTTRDQIREQFVIGDIPVSLVDLAGIRETGDVVESIGVERARKAVADADLVLVMLDASEGISAEDHEIINSVADIPHIVVINKIDKTEPTHIKQHLEDIYLEKRSPAAVIEISAKFGTGIKELNAAIVEPFADSDGEDSGFLVTDARHHDLLLNAANEVRSSIELLRSKQSEEIVLIGLHNALRYLGRITGETTTEDMLTRIFSTFCIGK